MASQATSAASLSAAVPGGHPASCWDPALLCRPGCFCLHGLGSLSLCLFFPVTTVQDSPCFPLPPFLCTLVVAAFPSPVNVDIHILLGNLEPPSWKAELAGTLTTHQDQARFPSAHPSSPCLVDSVTLYRIFCYCRNHWGPGPESRPQPAVS